MKKLRIGILLDSFEVDAWFYEMIKKITNENYAEIVLIVKNAHIKSKTYHKKTILKKLFDNYGQIRYLIIRKSLEKIYSTLIERHTYLPDAFKLCDINNIIKDIPIVEVKTIRKKWSDYFIDEDIRKIKRYDIDIFIRGGFGILRGEILKLAKYGIWSYHHGDNNVNRGGPAGFWESMESWPETGSILQILTEDLDNGIVLYRSYSCTDAMSVKDNRNNYFWKSLSFLPRTMVRLYNEGESKFFHNVAHENRYITFYSERLYVKPTNYELAILTLNKIREKIQILFNNKFYIDQWILLFDIRDTFSTSLWRYKKIIPPKDRFWADPHIIYRENKYYIFIEEYIYRDKKGHISVIEIDSNGKYKPPIKALEREYHLSYPFVFEYKGTFYMIPESLSNKTIELYKCIEFPNRWEFQMNLMEDVRAVDTTLFQYQGKWWMFVNMIENNGASSCDELFLFFSNELLSNKWKSHPCNPIVSDCKRARPAGKIFIKDGIIYRPSQNCSRRYGFGFNLNEILLLTEHEYKEKIVSTVKPNWDKNIKGTHTFNHTKQLYVIDAVYRRRK